MTLSLSSSRGANDLEVLYEVGVGPAQVREGCWSGEAKRRLAGHVQSIDWAYKPAGGKDYMRAVSTPGGPDDGSHALG